MSPVRVLAIARANMVRLLRDRLGLFFIGVLPMIIVLVTGLQFGGGFEPRVGLYAPDGGPLADDMDARLERSWQVQRYDDEARMAADVESGRLAFGVTLPPRYTERLTSGDELAIQFRAPPGQLALARRGVVAGAMAEQASLARAARFASAETGSSVADMMALAKDVSGTLADVEVDVRTVGESLFPESLTGFALGAQGQLVLFIFLTSLTGAAQLILSRTLGVSRRMLSTPTTLPTILLGEALGRFGVALFQGAFIVAATAIAFGVRWGDPVGAAALVIAFSLTCAGVAMLIGAMATNAEQASSIGVFAGLVVAAIGGSMIPPEIFPPIMDAVSWVTPHRWALDGFRTLLAGGNIVSIAPHLGVLLCIAAVLLAVGTWRLRVSLTR